MGSQALQSSMGRDLRLLNGTADRKHSELNANGRMGAAHHQSMLVESSSSSFTSLVCLAKHMHACSTTVASPLVLLPVSRFSSTDTVCARLDAWPSSPAR